MTRNPSMPEPARSLSVGNVVSMGIILYRSHLKTYLQQAMFAYLWLLLPIYGWAKFYEISARISRLAVMELMSKPENISSAMKHTQPKLWSFLGIAWRIFYRLFGVYLLWYLAIIILGAIAGVLAAFLGGLGMVIGGVILLAGFIGGIVFIVRLYSQWLIAEVPLAVETGINGKQSFQRSSELSKDAISHVQWVVAIAFLVTLPTIAATSFIPFFFLQRLEEGTLAYTLTYIVYLLSSLIGGALVLPFWQSLKGVLYYNLRNQREGIGLRLR